ncbi:hypothetical protein PHAVU_011G031300 [Phaseolus vulgaris]|uniref:Large ribosomal RNA subunit accumulation protein YCED homolog 2, chloroplastic n=1 Tax=Phaseolus vulgaris TaxID=3885 RepID=V7ADU6_PHAVU|nr:hypothetical protein PHAVU_011G031300g [Phaseolus vulgaris]ESW03654.1 hypothetical protein PHAVU_011G031300g [Phaseolus vulgaris]
MANAGNLVSPRSSNPIFNPCHSIDKLNTFRLLSRIHCYNNATVTVTASSKRKDDFNSPLVGKNTSRAARRLITISPSDGRYSGDWTSDYLVSLDDLDLQDLIEDDDNSNKKKNAQVFINLTVQKHASFGLSVDGRVTTSFTRKCSNCSTPYCRQVIYVRPGHEVDLGSLVQDAIRLTSAVKDSCSELCEKTEGTIQYITGETQASVDKRWSRLLALKKRNL